MSQRFPLYALVGNMLLRRFLTDVDQEYPCVDVGIEVILS